MDRSEIIVRMTSALKVVTVKRMMWNQVHQGMMASLFHCEVCKVMGHLYLVDHGLTDQMDLLFEECTTHIVNFCCHIEHIYVYMFACFVFVIYYDLQVHFCITG